MSSGSKSKHSTMQALALHAVGDLRYEAIPCPKPGPGEVRVRIGFCGVCGSDIPRIFVKGTYRFPTVCGHEFAGTVASVGPGVEDVEPGDPVAVFPLLWCDRCSACEAGQYVQCANYDYLGSRRDGAFAEFVVAPRRNLIRVPEGVSLEEASMTEPASVALHAVKRGGGCAPGETVAVFGAGPIGLMVAQWARAFGGSRILLFDIVPEKLAVGRELGFDLTFNSREEDAVKTIEALTGGMGAHLSIDAAGVPQTLIQAMAATKRGGRTVILGNPSADVTLPAPLISRIMRREIDLFGTWNSEYKYLGADDDWHATLEAMASKTLSLRPLITHRVKLQDAIDMLVRMKERREFFQKVLIHPD